MQRMREEAIAEAFSSPTLCIAPVGACHRWDACDPSPGDDTGDPVEEIECSVSVKSPWLWRKLLSLLQGQPVCRKDLVPRQRLSEVDGVSVLEHVMIG